MRYRFQPSLLLTFIMFVLFLILLSLGLWQLNRAAGKTRIQQQYDRRAHQEIRLTQLNDSTQDVRFYKLKLVGKFDNQHAILLDNKIVNHQIGYELYMPFYISDNDKVILVDRGFMPQGPSRHALPVIDPVWGEQHIEGMLNIPPASGLRLGTEETFQHQWPIRVSHIDLKQLSQLLNQDFYSYIFLQNQHNAIVSITSMTPDRHIAYAIQWFLLAVISLILYIILSLKKIA